MKRVILVDDLKRLVVADYVRRLRLLDEGQLDAYSKRDLLVLVYNFFLYLIDTVEL